MHDSELVCTSLLICAALLETEPLQHRAPTCRLAPNPRRPVPPPAPPSPFKDDTSYLLATWLLEEIGATGDKGSILLVSNPGVANCISGLAGAASAQGAVDRHFLWQRRWEGP
jgi:hypothetical protein